MREFHNQPRGQPSDELAEQYNILVLGETQSGKSTLIQYMRMYADPEVVIDTTVLGTTSLSHTMDIQPTSIATSLPEFYVTDKNRDIVNYGIADGDNMRFRDKSDYDGLLKRNDLTLEKGCSRLVHPVIFNLIDTPGLNATEIDDEILLQKIYNSLIGAEKIHLILITISSGPITQALKEAIEVYVGMFPDFNGVIAFVHTHFDYKNFHPERFQVAKAVTRKLEKLSDIMGRSTFPQFKIDCDVYNKKPNKPILECITLNSIQRILELATFNRSVNTLDLTINKTMKMRTIDLLLKDKFNAICFSIHNTLQFKNQEEGDLLSEIFRLETGVHTLEAKIQEAEEFLRRHDVDCQVLLHEERRDMDCHGREETVSIRYPQTEDLDFAIASRDLLCHNVNVINDTQSGEGAAPSACWEAQLQRVSLQSVFHVKLYAVKSNIHQAEIQKKRDELPRLLWQLQEAIRCRDDHAKQNISRMQAIQEIVDNQNEYIQILGQVSHTFLKRESFMALLDAQAYHGEIDECLSKVQEVYRSLTMEGQEEKLDPLVDVLIEPQSSPSDDIRPSTTIQKRSIIVLGKSQAGKSALVEHIRHYASPSYAINQSRLGDNIFSKTESASTIIVKSNLPSFEVYNKVSGDIIDFESLTKGADNMGGKGVDEEELQDLLFAREDTVGVRMAPDDPHKPSPDAMEFEILDTQGFCNHKGQDRDHAIGTIDAIVSTKTFSLILIIVNIRDPLTAELLLAFQYCSKILKSLHANIAFLYTQADGRLLTDPGRHATLADTTRFLRRIFQPPGSDGTRPFPTFTIDLTEKKLPVLQCILRNTIRDILQLAVSNTPVLMDTSRENMQRIKLITHPLDFDDLQRETALESIYGDPQKSKYPDRPPSLPSSVIPQSINILLIGDTHSGKTSLIESMKLYADPLSVSHVELSVKGENGVADEIMSGCSFIADLHTIEVFKVEKARDHRIISIKQEAEALTAQEFAELILLDHETVSTRDVRPNVSRKYQFFIFEVPGWQDDMDSPQNRATAIHRAISESNKEIHQVMVTLGPNAITDSTKTVISNLINLFPAIRPLLSFVHTKINYRNLHVSSSIFHDSTKDKKE
ncbi:hypothetical protein MVEG_12199 [Podila verticillata NRRL 6337]|uniref:Uncharacterized protein n=1 Tax=Podila verticillata NRRL 6337 TaxID=1069443 RepID=A0A086TJB8_9FUNG|nr:hypothetical protein MVEG_12199 [Podila verticillata NRRL 6337]